jgi:tetratricopeptide (TPR) repeat protein
MSLSDKELGNDCFRKGRYSDAIKFYAKYVQESHSDNQNAFFNISLCQSKMGRHKESIEAA